MKISPIVYILIQWQGPFRQWILIWEGKTWYELLIISVCGIVKSFRVFINFLLYLTICLGQFLGTNNTWNKNISTDSNINARQSVFYMREIKVCFILEINKSIIEVLTGEMISLAALAEICSGIGFIKSN